MTIRPFLTFCLITFSTLSNASILNGAWELQSGEYIDAEGKLVSYQQTNMQSIKLISDHYFSFTSTKGDQFWASATGRFEFKDGRYTETLLLNSFAEKVGAQFSFQAKVEGDYWYNSRWQDGKRVEYEVWKRMDE